MAVITLTFNDIFKDYTAFKAFTDTLSLYNGDSTSQDYDAFAESFNQHIYYVLANRYSNCNLAYDIEDDFIAEFGVAYQQFFKQFLQKKKLTDEIYKLTLDDYLIASESMNNFTNNPNYITQDAWETLTYISQQSRGRAKAGKLLGYINALRQMPDAQIDAMIKAFDYLWLDILPTKNIYLY